MIQSMPGKGEDEVKITPSASLFKPFLSLCSTLSKLRSHVGLKFGVRNFCLIEDNGLGSCMLVTLSCLAALTGASFWHRLLALFTTILVARLIAGIVCPITAIAFKWIVIGRYQPGTYPM